MKTKKTTFQFKKSGIVELNNQTLNTIVGGTNLRGECFFCINTSNGPGGVILQGLKQA